jgi:hypothetical protein
MAGQAAQGPLPTGMLRIRQGNQERYVWPVHLPGWLALGWRVAGAAGPQAPIPEATGDLLEDDDAKPASPRGRRGRRRKDELPVDPADTGTSSDGDNGDSIGVEPSEPARERETTAEPDSESEIPVLNALPDDLFDDPLI